MDESAFSPLPARVRTWARRGQTPILTATLTHDHLSVIGGITQDGALYTTAQTHAFTSVGIVRFLKHLLRHIEGNLVVIWDGATIHRSRVVKAFLATPAAKRLHLERLPGYAPELNAIELLWKHLKRVLMPNRDFRGLGRLWDALTAAFAKVRRRPDLLRSFIDHVDGLVR